jgi:hypothetical protein
VLPSFAQTHVRDLPATFPTMIYLDRSTATSWLYVAEHGEVPPQGSTAAPPGGGRILRFNVSGTSTTPQVVATRGTGAGQFISPDGIVMNSAGRLFVADRFLNRVVELSIDATTGVGTQVSTFGTATAGATEMRGPLGLAIDAAGAIYVSEHGEGNPGTGGNMVSKWALVSGTWTRQWRVPGEGFNTPYGIAISGTEVLVSDGFNGRVQILNTSDGAVARANWGVGNVIPLGLSVDGTNVWVTEATGNTGGTQRVMRRSIATGTADLTISAPGSGPMQFALPFHAVRNPTTNLLYVSDYNNNRVQVLDLAAPTGTAPVINSQLTASVAANASFTYTITATNSPTTFNATPLPTGLTRSGATISGSVAAAGTYNIDISATNASGTDTKTLALTVTSVPAGDTASPVITAFALTQASTPAPDGSGTAQMTVTFDEAVTGVDAADFLINTTSGAAATVTGVTPAATTSSASWVVSFSYPGTAGALQMGIRTASTGITDAAGNPFRGEGRTGTDAIQVNASGVSTVIPTVASVTAGTQSGNSLPLTVTFSEAVTGFAQPADVLIKTTGSATGTVASITAVSTTVYNVAVTVGGTGTVEAIVVGGVTSDIRDATTHWFVGGGTPSSGAVTLGSTGSTAPEINLQGNGASIASGDTTPAASDHTDFGSVAVASGTIVRTFTIQNTGNAALTLSGIQVTGTNASDFTVALPASMTVAASGSATFTVTFDPSASGARNAIVNVLSNDADESTYTFAVTGTGTTTATAPEINLQGNGVSIASGDITPSLLDHTDFGSVNITGGTVARTFTIQNTGSAALTLTSVTTTGTNAAEFVVTPPASMSIAANSSATFVVTFDPTVASARNATVQIVSNDADEATYTFAITGTGTTTTVTAPEINVQGNAATIASGDTTPSPTDHTDFGGVDIATGTLARTFTIQNTGDAALAISLPIQISGTHAADFTVTTAPAASVAASGSTTFVVTFNPSATGARNATITINNSDSDEAAYTFAVAGNGTTTATPAPEINVLGNSASIASGDTTPSATDHTAFGDVDVTAGTMTRTFTIQNSGNAALAVTLPIHISGTHAADFTVTTAPAASVAANGSTTFIVTFNPSASGARNATITINNSDSDEAAYTFAVSGNGTTTTTTAPEINILGNGASIASGDITPSAADHTDFGDMNVTTGTVARTFTIQNTGNAALTVTLPIQITGAAAADFTVTTAPAASVAANGSTTFVVTFNPSASGARNATITINNNDGNEGTYTFAVTGNGTTTTTPAVPVITSATIAGQVGTAISPVTLTATGSPTAWSASGLSTYGLTISNAGVISGTPTSVASNVSVSVSATNSAGTGTGSVTLNLAAAPNPNPNPGGGGGGGGGPIVVFPPIVVKQNQTITFVSPVNTIFVGKPALLGASASSSLPITYTVVSGNATISNGSITINNTSPVIVRASQEGNSTYNAAATVEVELRAQKNAQLISMAAIADALATAGQIALNASSDAGLPVTFTVTGPATISGNTLRLNGAAGTVTVTATQSGNDAYLSASTSRTFAVRAVGSQVFFGKLGNEDFAAGVNAAGSKGVFLTRLSTGQGLVIKFDVKSNGSFSATTTASAPVAELANGFFVPPTAAAGQTYTVNGTITNGVLSGTIVELGQNFTANIQPSVGSTAALAGVYTATAPGSASGETYIVAGPNGQAYALVMTPTGAVAGTGTISSSGEVKINAANNTVIAANIQGNQLNGTVTAAGAVSNIMGLSDATARTDRLVNLSSRLRVASGDASRSVIAGFVVTGTEKKKVLVRAVGPGLSGFGVGGVLTNPSVQIFSGSTLVAENNDWSNNADVSAIGDSVGAFKLNNNSQDAAMVVELAPGAYTAVVQANGGNGVALIEVYDASTNTALNTQQLVNISTRGYVDTGDGQLIAGFVVTGNAPKRVLIRGIGPGLSQFSVPGVVADPQLKVFAAGNTLVAQNDDWSTPQAINANQVAATAADIAAASTATGAFPLAAGSKDAAIVITLMPGQYSAVVNGANNGTGAGLVEVYEIPNL